MKTARRFVLSLLPGLLLFFAQTAHAGGLTIITHGFGSGIDDWVHEMAEAIANRATGQTVILKLSVKAYVLPLTGDVIPYVDGVDQVAGPSLWSNQHNGEVILKVDWSEIDDLSPITPAEDIGQVVGDYLLTHPVSGHLLIEQPIHLIGHSRGTSVNSTVAELLAERNVWVDHVTTLDPHPVALWGDAPVVCWDNIRFADNWYRSGVPPNGMLVAGAQNADLSDLLTGLTAHTLVHTFYHGTIATDATVVDREQIQPAWYNLADPTTALWTGPRSLVGFYWSHLGAGSSENPSWAIHRPRAGLSSSLGGAGQRTNVARDGEQWPNIEIDGLLDDRTVIQGTGIGVSGRASAGSATATVIVGFDTDGNPYNGVAGIPAYTLTTDMTGESALEATLPTSALQAGSMYYLYAQISQSGLTRTYYMPGRIMIQPPNPPPSSIVLTCSGSPNPVSPNSPFRVSGTATYDNGTPVSVGTATISVGERSWTASNLDSVETCKVAKLKPSVESSTMAATHAKCPHQPSALCMEKKPKWSANLERPLRGE